MGAFLATPKTEKHSEFGGSKDEMTSEYGASAMQGWRQTMEDAHVAIPSLKALVESSHATPPAECAKAFAEMQAMDIDDIGIYGVFDGHGSNAVSQWTAANLLTVRFSLCRTFLITDTSALNSIVILCAFES